MEKLYKVTVSLTDGKWKCYVLAYRIARETEAGLYISISERLTNYIRKKSLMRVQKTRIYSYNNISYETFCLPKDVEKTIEILHAEVFKKLEKFRREVNKIRSSAVQQDSKLPYSVVDYELY